MYHRVAQQRQKTSELYDEYEEIVITLLLVDDERLARQGLRIWLEQAADITVIGEASNGAEAIAREEVKQLECP